MNSVDQSVLLEQIQNAVRPLTDKGQFRFGTIRYDVYSGVFEFWLQSDEIKIKFLIRLIFATQYQVYDTREFLICLPMTGNNFLAEHLLLALNIPVILKRESQKWGIRKEQETGNSIVRCQVEILLEDDTLFSAINEFCTTVNLNLPLILTSIRPESLEEIIRKYNHSIETSRNPGDRYNLSMYSKYARMHGG